MDNTKTWDKLASVKAWNNRLDTPYYDMVDVNWEMFKGNQYVNSGAQDDLPKPIFNIIKRIITFFCASLTSSPVDIKFSNFADTGESEVNEEDVEMLNSAFNNFAERVKLQSLVRDAYKDGAITGDYAFHMYYDGDVNDFNGKYSDVKGSLALELVDGVNIGFGNPNSRDIDKQPYVLVTGRDMVENLQKEYDDANKEDSTIGDITSDNDTQYQAGYDSRIEIEADGESGKATYVYMYTIKENKQGKRTVHVTKSVKELDIFKDIDLGLTKIPVIMGNWERQKNNYHGLALCTAIIPNQIFINRMFAMVMKSLMNTAFPKAVYDADRVTNWTSRVGRAIGIKGRRNGERLGDIATYLDPGQMSSQITGVIDMAWEYTKETLGANDALLGNVNPEQASGAAISVTAKQSAIPLLNPKNNMYDAMERLGEIFIDCVTTYYGERAVVKEEKLVDDMTGEETTERSVSMYNFEKLKDTFLTVKVDVGASTYYDELAKIMTYERYLSEGWITFKETLEALPSDYFPNKDEIMNRIATEEQATQQGAGVPMEIVSQIIDQLPAETRQAAIEYIDQALQQEPEGV